MGREFLIGVKVPPLAPIGHNVYHQVTVLVMFSVPAKSLVIVGGKVDAPVLKSGHVPQARLRWCGAQTWVGKSFKNVNKNGTCLKPIVLPNTTLASSTTIWHLVEIYQVLVDFVSSVAIF